MNYLNMRATVYGHDCSGKEFTDSLEFTLLPPADDQHYGTGYYMRVAQSNPNFNNQHLVDVRYERTTDVEILADRWIENYYGKNAEDVRKEFLSPQPELVPMPGADRLKELYDEYCKS